MLESLRASFYYHRRDIISLIALTLLTIFIFMPIMQRYSSTGDFPQHNQLALDFLANPAEFLRNTPHYLYHIFTGMLYLLLGDISLAGIWLMLLCYIAQAWIIYWQLRKASGFLGSAVLILLCIDVVLILNLIMPINFFTPENLYFGYFAPNVYHNPTINLVKPFALLLFFMSLRIFKQEKPLSHWWIIPFALLTFLSLVAKPSFMIAFLPTLGLFCIFFLFSHFKESLGLLLKPLHIIRGFLGIEDDSLPQVMQRRFINWPVLLGGILLPTFLVIYVQTLTWTSSGGIGIEPFRLFDEWVIQNYDKNANQLLLWKFLMSCAFPLVVYLLHLPQAFRSLKFNLAWLFFFVGTAYIYLLVDYTDVDAGDFGWSIQLGSYILYIVAATFLLEVSLRQEQRSPVYWLRLGICLMIFALHFVAGLHWYNLHMRQDILELIYIWW